ncbi:MAG: zinc ribbon domain-containing protein [Sutterella sp.]
MLPSATADSLPTFDESRIAQFESDAVPQYRTVIRTVDISALSADDIRALDDLIKAFGQQLGCFLQQFLRRENRRLCQGTRYFEWRNRLVRAQQAANAQAKAQGCAPQSIFPYGLQARQWKMALQSASDITERHFRLLQTKTMKRLRSREVWNTLTDTEKHYINGLFCALSDRFFDLLDGKVPEPSQALTQKGGLRRPRQLCNLLLEILREVNCREPSHGESRTVWFDAQCWTLKREADGTDRVKVMTLTPGKRVELRLKGRGPVRGTLMLVRSSEGFFVHVLQKIKPKKAKSSMEVSEADTKPKQLTVRSADMGMTEVFTDDEGKRYGTRLGKLIQDWAEAEEECLRQRNQLYALAKNTKSAVKRRNILKFNLGSKKWEKRRHVFREKIESEINHALNQMLRDRKPDVFIVEALGELFRMEGISKRIRNRLSRWVRGLINERLLFKAAVYGVRIAKVPAAYSSQCCPVCGYVHPKNRNGDQFCCQHCEHKNNADRGGALNLIARVRDPFFAPGQGKEAIRKHLRQKYEEYCRLKGEQPKEEAPLRKPVKRAKSKKTDS